MWRSEAANRCHKVLPGGEIFHHQGCVLKRFELFLSTKRKLYMPLDTDCDSDQSHEVNYSIHLPNTRAKNTCIGKSLTFVEHGLAHITSTMEANFFSFPLAHCKIVTQLCQKMLGDANQYWDFVQCQSQKWQVWHPCSCVQGIKGGVSLHQQCEVRVLVFP